MIIPVIMCGGAGTRLWPASRASTPKQFIPLFGERSTFQDTVIRVGAADLFEKPIILTHSDFRFIAAEQLRSRQEIRLRGVGLVVEQILGHELRGQPLQPLGVDELALQITDVLAHQPHCDAGRCRGHVQSAKDSRVLDERCVHVVREVPSRADIGEHATGEHGRGDPECLEIALVRFRPIT